jgi:FtsH-binding integral membrane protein
MYEVLVLWVCMSYLCAYVIASMDMVDEILPFVYVWVGTFTSSVGYTLVYYNHVNYGGIYPKMKVFSYIHIFLLSLVGLGYMVDMGMIYQYLVETLISIGILMYMLYR